MISPLRATPDMSMPDIAKVINDLADQVQSENRTKIIVDEEGVKRAIIGMAPNGEYLIAISAKGVDVQEALGG